VDLLARIAGEGFPEADEAEREAATGLDKHYISARYPDAFESQIPAEQYTLAMAEEALEWAKLLLRYSGDNLI